MNNKTVAIAGFSTTTLGALRDSKADEIWTLNHAFVMDFAFPRFDRIFELHKYGWFLRTGDHKLTKYYNWLRQKHGYPIYMQKVYKVFPDSVRYPKEEIDEFIFGKLIRGTERNLYYSSSFSYMIALAVYEGVKRIEIYGVDMANNTEYNFQKPGGEFMLGVAVGHGVEVVLQPNSALCLAQVYAYDKVPAVDRKHAVKLADVYDKQHEHFKKETETHAELYRTTKDPAPYMGSAAFSAMYTGAAKALHKLLEGDAYYFGRQALENARHEYFVAEEQWLAQTNEKHSNYETRAVIDSNGGAGRAWNEYLEARWSMYAYSGARQAIQKLIDECDMRVVPDELRLEIKDA